MANEIKRSCIDCGSSAFCESEGNNHPEFCTTANMDTELIAQVAKLYIEDEQNAAITKHAAAIEAEYYCKMTRVEETAELALRMGFKKIGIATCVGLLGEARIAARIFRNKGLEVVGIGCKVGAQKKSSVGIDVKCEDVGCNMCNPIMQATLLNEEKTDMNVIIGLCVGHDMLFTKYSEAPVTTLVAKDRVLGHNPCVALYQTGTYYSKLVK